MKRSEFLLVICNYCQNTGQISSSSTLNIQTCFCNYGQKLYYKLKFMARKVNKNGPDKI